MAPGFITTIIIDPIPDRRAHSLRSCSQPHWELQLVIKKARSLSEEKMPKWVPLSGLAVLGIVAIATVALAASTLNVAPPNGGHLPPGAEVPAVGEPEPTPEPEVVDEEVPAFDSPEARRLLAVSAEPSHLLRGWVGGCPMPRARSRHRSTRESAGRTARWWVRVSPACCSSTRRRRSSTVSSHLMLTATSLCSAHSSAVSTGSLSPRQALAGTSIPQTRLSYTRRAVRSPGFRAQRLSSHRPAFVLPRYAQTQW